MGREKRSHAGRNSFKMMSGEFSLEFTPLRSALKTPHSSSSPLHRLPSSRPCQIRRQKAQERHAATVGGVAGVVALLGLIHPGDALTEDLFHLLHAGTGNPSKRTDI